MRITVQILLVFVFMNAFAGMLQTTGVADDLNVNPQPGGDEKLDQINNETENFESGGGGGETLFGLYNTLAGVLDAIVDTLPALAMMKNAGAPDFIVNYGFAGYSIITGLDIAGYIRSGGLME